MMTEAMDLRDRKWKPNHERIWMRVSSILATRERLLFLPYEVCGLEYGLIKAMRQGNVGILLRVFLYLVQLNTR